MMIVNIHKKQQQILDTARDLFWKYGFKRVSIEEICQKAKVSKMTYYRFYSNKIELAKAVFDKEVRSGILSFKAIMSGEDSPSEKVKKILMMKMEGTNNISQEFLMDFYKNPEIGLKAYIEEKTKIAWQEILNDFKEAQQQGLFRKDFKPEFILYLSQKMGEMITDEHLLKLYGNPQDVIKELVNFFIYGITPHE